MNFPLGLRSLTTPSFVLFLVSKGIQKVATTGLGGLRLSQEAEGGRDATLSESFIQSFLLRDGAVLAAFCDRMKSEWYLGGHVADRSQNTFLAWSQHLPGVHRPAARYSCLG